MPKKILLNEKQFELVVNYVKETEKKQFIGVLTEDVQDNKQILEEGWKEVVLATAMLLGLGLTGHNKVMAQKAIQNDTVMSQVKQTLEGDKIADIASALEKAGLRNAMEKIEDNAEKLESNFNKHSKTMKLDIKTVKSDKDLKNKVSQGYAVKDVKTTSDTLEQKTTMAETSVSMDYSFGSDNMFVTAGFQLSDGGQSAIMDSIKAIQAQGGRITSITIESSTDTEPIKMGNQKLSELRANSVKEVIESMKLGVDSIHVNALHDQGPNVYSTSMSKEQRQQARTETSSYRYVKISITADFSVNVPPEPTLKIITKTTYEVVKAIESSSSSTIKMKHKFKAKKFHCKKMKSHGKTDVCPRF